MKTKKNIFTKKHFTSSDGMVTRIWGPSMWHFLHTLSFNYPTHPCKEDKIHYKNFMLSLTNVLPCKHCRDNLKKNYKKRPITNEVLKNRDSFSRYIYNLHEDINKMLNKKSNIKYQDVRTLYENFRSRCKTEKKRKIKKKKESGCRDPLYGKKAKCVINIVPDEEKCKTFNINKKCLVHK